MYFEGRVIDGPWEGKQITKAEPYFTIHWTDPVSVFAFDPNEPPSITNMHNGLYKWSRSLKAWCFVG